MNLVADEGVERHIVDSLRQNGHVVRYIAELTPGIDDEQVLEGAISSGAVLVTTDKDFGELVFRLRRASALRKYLEEQGQNMNGSAMGHLDASTPQLPLLRFARTGFCIELLVLGSCASVFPSEFATRNSHLFLPS